MRHPSRGRHRPRDRVRLPRLLERGVGEQPVEQVEDDVVEHDGRDDLVGPGRRFQDAGDEPGHGPADRAGEDHKREVDADRQVHLEADLEGGQGTGDQLPLATDIEHSGGKPKATPMPARMSGVAATSVSEIGVNTAVQPVRSRWRG